MLNTTHKVDDISKLLRVRLNQGSVDVETSFATTLEPFQSGAVDTFGPWPPDEDCSLLIRSITRECHSAVEGKLEIIPEKENETVDLKTKMESF